MAKNQNNICELWDEDAGRFVKYLPSISDWDSQVWEAGVEFIVQISGQKMKAELHLRWEQESGQDRGEAVTCLSIGTKVNVAMLPIVTPRSYRILYWGKVSSGMLLITIFTRPSYFGKKFSVPCCQLTVYISRPTLETLPAFLHVFSFFWLKFNGITFRSLSPMFLQIPLVLLFFGNFVHSLSVIQLSPTLFQSSA